MGQFEEELRGKNVFVADRNKKLGSLKVLKNKYDLKKGQCCRKSRKTKNEVEEDEIKTKLRRISRIACKKEHERFFCRIFWKQGVENCRRIKV